MDVVEAPQISNDDAPLGTLVVLSLDPVASVADMNDEEASAAAAKLPRGKYLALVFSPEANFFAPLDIQPLTFTFFGIGHGPPLKRPDNCLGLGPQATHPDGREPLETSIPVPWNDCYIHFRCKFRAIVTRLHLAPAGARCAVPRSDIRTIIMIESEENSLAESDASGEVDNALEYSLGPSGSTPDLDARGELERSPGNVNESSPARKSEGSDGSSDRLNRLYHQPPQMRTRAEIWLDLTSIDAFDPPSQIKETLVQLKQIETEWAVRAAAALMVDRPLTSQWATDVAGAEPLDPNSAAPCETPDFVDVSADRCSRSGPGPAPIDDGEVRPEDAVDYRLEAPTAPHVDDPAPPSPSLSPLAIQQPSVPGEALSYISPGKQARCRGLDEADGAQATSASKLKSTFKRATAIVVWPAKKVIRLFPAWDRGKK